ncbi:MAG: PQQ-like beta-propeller repeat protein [Sulfurovum sp.]|nr:PQQ-like beta-propeller repeat protein [Sulfurovum sp.]
MKTYLLSLLAVGTLYFSGCSSRQYFEPENTYSVSVAESGYGGTIVELGRNGATLADGHYIGKNGIGKIVLGEGFRFLGESGQYVLAANSDGLLEILDKNSGKVVRKIEMELPVVSAGIKGDLVAYILANNAFGLYSIKKGEKIIENRSERTYAIDTRAASPLFVDSLVVMPMLDGKLVIFDTNDPENAKVVYLSSDKVFNNVIYLSRTGDTLVAATPKKLLTLGSQGEFEYKANIAEVAVSGNNVYLFTKEGDIIKFDITLNELAKKKFRFAQFSAATVVDGRVYALDNKGSLIVLNKDLTKYKIYDVGEVDEPVYIAGNKLYKDGNIIHLDRLKCQ